MSSFLSVAKKLSATALSKQSPRLPIDAAIPAARALLAEGQRDVLAALVGVMDQPGAGRRRASAICEGVDDELGAHVIGHRPADDPAGEDVLDGGEVEPALPGAQVGDVGDPEPVRAPRRRTSRSTRSSQTRTPGTRIVVRPGAWATRPERPAWRIEPLDALAPDPLAVAEHELGVDARRPIDPAVRCVDLADPLEQPLRPRARAPTAARAAQA